MRVSPITANSSVDIVDLEGSSSSELGPMDHWASEGASVKRLDGETRSVLEYHDAAGAVARLDEARIADLAIATPPELRDEVIDAFVRHAPLDRRLEFVLNAAPQAGGSARQQARAGSRGDGSVHPNGAMLASARVLASLQHDPQTLSAALERLGDEGLAPVLQAGFNQVDQPDGFGGYTPRFDASAVASIVDSGDALTAEGRQALAGALQQLAAHATARSEQHALVQAQLDRLQRTGGTTETASRGTPGSGAAATLGATAAPSPVSTPASIAAAFLAKFPPLPIGFHLA